MSATDLFAKITGGGSSGIAVLDAQLRVTEALGAAAVIGLRTGAFACENGVLAGMEESLLEMQAQEAAMLHVPNLSIGTGQGADNQRYVFSLRLFWNRPERKFLMLVLEEDDNVRIIRSVVEVERKDRIEREQMQAILDRVRSVEFMYRDVVEKSSNIILRTDEAGVIVFANAAAVRSANAQSGQLQNCGLDRFFPGAQVAPSWSARLRQARAGEVCTFESETVDTAGQSRWLAWTVTWLGESGVQQFQLVAHDVTDARMLDLERVRANRIALSAAISNERFRIARDLHDTLVKAILSVHAQLRLIGRLWSSAGLEELRSEVALAEKAAGSGIAAAREAIFEMRLELSPEHPFGKMLQKLADNAARRSGLAFDVNIPETLAAAHDSQAEGLYRIVSEAVRNIEQHARARKIDIAIDVAIADGKAALSARIADDGVGFDAAIRKPMHFGLTGMAEQAKQLGGDLEIRSAPGAGTTIVLKVESYSAAAISP
ncbi:MAG: ATP-binding protein [Beijerinckiaceae bacterium]